MDTLSLQDPRLVELLEQGGVGVLPTDTVYGLVCDASNTDAVEKLYRLKSREKKPGVLVAADVEQVRGFGFPLHAVEEARRFWPGVSVVLPLGEDVSYLHQGVGALAVRVVADGMLQMFLQKTGPLLTSSANLPGESPANTLEEARAYFRDAVDFYVDGGDLSGRQSSTLIRVVNGKVEVLRQGSIRV
ncbi:Sua5/YciO/YrdC/YwlC family protein [bacterium]|nr:Sua5/YciO/YrdC/YwlC family protein [bacterium]